MVQNGFVLITDRGGHLSNALQLVAQMGVRPDAIITTYGPDIDSLKKEGTEILEVPYLFSWWGKIRFLNPLGVLRHIWTSMRLAFKTRPRFVVSVGATNVVLYCYWARILGAEIYHVECMNQVKNPSITGKLLYPICQELLVQWPGLLSQYGLKARYEGWVL
jgi:beta-1,4-N-acetylglucosaminyltransferase